MLAFWFFKIYPHVSKIFFSFFDATRYFYSLKIHFEEFYLKINSEVQLIVFPCTLCLSQSLNYVHNEINWKSENANIEKN